MDALGIARVGEKIRTDFRIETVAYAGGGLGGGVKDPSPRNGENCCIKMISFPTTIFLQQPFQKVVNNLICLLHFHHKFSRFSQNCQNRLCFASKCAKI